MSNVNEGSMVKMRVEEAAFSADELGRANFLAAKPGNRIVDLKAFPRIAAYFGLDGWVRDEKTHAYSCPERKICLNEDHPIGCADRQEHHFKTIPAGTFLDETGRPHVVGVINSVTYRELIEKP